MKISGYGYQIEIDGKGAYSIIREGSGKGFKNAHLEYETLSHGLVDDSHLEVESLDEGKNKASIKYRGSGGKATLNFSIKEDGVFITAEVKHSGPLGRISPMVMEGDPSSLCLTENIHHLRFMRPGYQSWSPSGSWSILKKEPYPYLKMIERGAFHPLTGFKPSGGRYHSDYASIITDPKTGSSLLIGFVTAKKYLPSLNLEMTSDPRGAMERISVRAFCNAEFSEKSDASIVVTETMMVACGDDPHELWERYLSVAGKSMEARIRERAPVGWCSWYHYFALITEKTFRANLEEMMKRKAEMGVEVFQLDDGYCAVGDWLEWNDKFPSGGAALARDIESAGFQPGLWVAPFICCRGSKTFKEHRDWLLKDEKGKPLLVGLNPWWKGKAFYALDLTNPDALGYVEKVMKKVKEWGYRFVKIDFVYAALLQGQRHDPSKTGLEAYREGLAAIRRSLGDDVFLLGCGAPILPSVGFVDGMRVSPDVAQYWRSKITGSVAVAPIDPAAENAIHGTVCRSAMHKRLWINDPDCLLVRKAKSMLSIDEIRTLATVIFLSGGQLLISDDITELDQDRWEIIRACLPQIGKAARPVDLFNQEDPRYYYLDLPEKERRLLGIVNWKNKAFTPSIEPGELGLNTPHYAFEFWTRKYLGIVRKDSKPLPVPLKPHGCALINLVPVTGKARVIGTSLHMAMGAVELAKEEVDGNELKISIELPGPRKGRVYAAIPGKSAEKAIVSKEIAFMDKVKFEIPLG